MAENNNQQERRRFSRIPLHISANLFHADYQLHDVQVIDISLNGLLIEKTYSWKAQAGETFDAKLNLESSDVEIHMQLQVSHVDQYQVGFICEHIDLESMSHLKRIVELNTGDEDLLHRELSHLLE